MQKIIILIGPPGSGKGTQARKIADKYNYGHISTGDLLRAIVANGSADEKETQALEEMKKGGLVPSWLIYRLAFREIDKYINKDQGVVLDGAIRSVEQADHYQNHFKDKGLDYNEVNMVLLGNHGPFAWGETAAKAVYNSKVLEEVARMAQLTLQINPNAPRLKDSLIKKHYERKHGKDAYYGQGC